MMENMAMRWLITIAMATAALLVFGAAWTEHWRGDPATLARLFRLLASKTARQVTGSG
jgi:hypothetical protein